MSETKKFRYPGVKFFEEDQINIYFGREKETEDVFSLIMTNKILVLHGESGNGKSSLVRAGLIPYIKKNNPEYEPIIVSLSLAQEDKKDSEELLIEIIGSAIGKKKNLSKDSLPYVGEKKNDLWYYAKLLEKQESSLLLIFDQFEEFQQFTNKQQELFKEKLFELLSSNIPKYIHDEIFKNTENFYVDSKIIEEKKDEYNLNMEFLKKPVRAKVLFVIREDKLGTMSLMNNYFTDILGNEYNLLALNPKSACNAISLPAKVEDGFSSPKFEFEDDAVKYIIDQCKVENSLLIDPFQMQIVCKDIEERVIKKDFVNNSNKIKEADIGEIQDKISSFYNHVWEKVRLNQKLGKTDFNKKRKALLEKLVYDKRRTPVIKQYLINDDNDGVIINTLAEEGIIRKIPSGKEEFYQLSHDKLIEPLSNDLEALVKSEKNRKTLLKILAPTSFVIIALILFSLYAYKKNSDKNKNLLELKKEKKKTEIAYKNLEIQKARAIAEIINNNGDGYNNLMHKSIACARYQSALDTLNRYVDSTKTDSLYKNLEEKLKECPQKKPN